MTVIQNILSNWWLVHVKPIGQTVREAKMTTASSTVSVGQPKKVGN